MALAKSSVTRQTTWAPRGNGESIECGLDLVEEDNLFTRLCQDDSFLNLNIVKIVKGLVSTLFQLGAEGGLVLGFIVHITEYFGFFTYPPNPLLSISFTC